MYNMTHYCTREKDGTIHVQNAIMGIMGQHHVHTAKEFEAWKKPGDAIEWLDCEPCDCGLKTGEVREGK